jgi:hypothetical protein
MEEPFWRYGWSWNTVQQAAADNTKEVVLRLICWVRCWQLLGMKASILQLQCVLHLDGKLEWPLIRKLDMSDGTLTYRELWYKTLKEGDHLEHIGIDGEIILNGSWRNMVEGYRFDHADTRLWAVAGLCKRYSKIRGTINGVKIAAQVRKCWILTKEYLPVTRNLITTLIACVGCVMCGCFGITCTCIYCVFLLILLCIFILICYYCKDYCHRVKTQLQ